MSAKDSNDTIDEATAIAWTTAYRSRMALASTTKAFLIPLDDLQGAIDEIKNQTGPNPMARAYLAYDPVKGEDKLVICGTTQDNSDPKNPVWNDMLPSTGPGNQLWDFTKPCPTYCDNNSSPLNN